MLLIGFGEACYPFGENASKLFSVLVKNHRGFAEIRNCGANTSVTSYDQCVFVCV